MTADIPASVSSQALVEALASAGVEIAIADSEGDLIFGADTLVFPTSVLPTSVLSTSVLPTSESRAETDASAAIGRVVEGAHKNEQSSQTVDFVGPHARTLRIEAAAIPASEDLVALVIQDVTELHRLRDIRRDFVANISHELKTPVGAVSLLAEQLVEENNPATVSRLAAHIHDEALRLGKLIEDLLDLSRLEAEGTPKHDPVLLSDVVSDAQAGRRALAENDNVVIHIESEPNVYVSGDQRLLTSAVKNLLENAIKYSDPGGAVVVRARQDGDEAVITVSDDGIGIPAEHVESIFHRFHRVDEARARRTGGSGLGLSIVRHIANTHRGTVEVNSEEGRGSVFTLRLPAIDLKAGA